MIVQLHATSTWRHCIDIPLHVFSQENLFLLLLVQEFNWLTTNLLIDPGILKVVNSPLI